MQRKAIGGQGLGNNPLDVMVWKCTVDHMPKRKTATESGEGAGQLAVRLSAQTNRAINEVCDARGYSRDRFIARLLTTWAAAPASVQNAMLGDVPSDLLPAVRAAWIKFFDQQFAPPDGAAMIRDSRSGQQGE